MTEGQRIGLEQLQDVAAAPRSPLEIIGSSLADSGELAVIVSVACDRIATAPCGMPLRARERFRITIPVDFPFEPPSLFSTHKRFVGYPHVFWFKWLDAPYLCLYQAPDTEWNPSDGIFGFLARMDLFLRHAAIGELDPIGVPMHPPLAPPSGAGGLPLIIPRADTPCVEQNNWFGFAHFQQVTSRRLDIVQWSDLVSDEWPPPPLAAAILMNQPLGHIFPETIGELIRELGQRGASRNLLVSILHCALLASNEGDPLILIVGAPMRGVKGEGFPKQHLTAWYIDSENARRLRLSMPRPDDTEELRVLRQDFENLVLEILSESRVHWCPILEARAEIVVRRDQNTPMNWFAGKQVAIWGCGAIGAHLAESVARAGAARIVLYDGSSVKPGILVRQPFEDSDIGFRKADMLKKKLERICPDLIIESNCGDVRQLALGRSDWHDGTDVVFDATASRSVLTKVEMARTLSPRLIPICSFVIGRQARRSMLVVSGAQFSGGPFDAARSAKTSLIDTNQDSQYLEDFFPKSSGVQFQPEPGCSEPTFVGSHADVLSLTSSMLNSAASALELMDPKEAIIHFAEQPALFGNFFHPVTIRIPSSLVTRDPESNFQVRVAPRAWERMLSHIETSAWCNGKRVETGGIVLGEKDEMLRIMWIDEFTPPPPDSILSATEFVCGTSGTQDIHTQHDKKYRGSVRYIGMWHTHPDSAPVPSSKDAMAMRQLARSTGSSAAHLLMLIVGLPFGDLCLGTYVFARREIERSKVRRICAISYPAESFGRPRPTHRGNNLRRIFSRIVRCFVA